MQIKKYLPSELGVNHPNAAKFLCEVKGNYAALFPHDQIKQYGTVVLCGGECKAIQAAKILNPQGIGAVCSTGGEGAELGSLAYALEGKRVVIFMDGDKAGRWRAASIVGTWRISRRRCTCATCRTILSPARRKLT